MTWKRVATAVVLIPAVLAVVFAAATSWLAIAVAAVMWLALFEFFALGDAIGHSAYKFWTATCAGLLVFVQYLFLIGVAVLTLATKRPLVEALPAAGISSSGLLLVALPLTYAVRLHAISQVGSYLLFFALLITWVGDTAAYFVGRAMGRHPFAPHLSPKKTWEGAVASFAGALLVGLAVNSWGHLNIPTIHVLGMAAAGNVAGQMGDLLESAYKRSAGVKDSGALLPGHGGILDRIDALILTFPVVWYYWLWIYSPRA